MLSPEVGGAIRDMPSGTHAMLVYDSKQNKRDVLFSHLKFGVGRAGLVYACSEERPTDIREGLDQFGVDVRGLESEGALMVKNYDEVYIVGGKVDAPKIISGFSKLAWEHSKGGKEGMRASAEMSCFLREGKVSDLMEYESALHKNFDFPGRGICAYSLLELESSGNLEILWPLIKTHALVVMTGPNGSFALPSGSVNQKEMDAVVQRTRSSES